MEKLMSDQVLRQYEYKVSKSHGIRVFIFAGLIALFGLYNALYSNKGLSFFNMIELSPNMANYFWWGISVLCLMVAAEGLLTIKKSFQNSSLITLYDSQMTTPKSSISNKMLTVSYSELSKIKIQKISKVRQLRIDSSQGKIVIPDVNFVNKTDFDDMVNILMQKAPR